MSASRSGKRQLIGAALLLIGVFLVFVCLPMQVFVIALGVVLAAVGLMLIR